VQLGRKPHSGGLPLIGRNLHMPLTSRTGRYEWTQPRPFRATRQSYRGLWLNDQCLSGYIYLLVSVARSGASKLRYAMFLY
jgi:hypothetical protein